MKKSICLVVVLVICVTSIFTYVQAVDSSSLQDQKEQIQNQRDSANQELENVKEELSENLEQVRKLDEQISNSQAELDKLNNQISELQNTLNETNDELSVAQENYSKKKELLDNRLIAVYESSDTQYLDVILSSKSITDFLSNYFLITEIANYDTQLLEEIQNKKEEIENKKKKLEETKEQLSTTKANKTKTAKVLESSRTIRQNFVDKLSEQEKDLQKQIEEYDQKYKEINDEILSLAQQGTNTVYVGGEFAWPVPGYTRITSKYGMRLHPILHVYKLHSGVDISAPIGANFVAANDGVVTKATYSSSYGNMVMIDHGGGISTLYAHGSQILVSAGQHVQRGEAILKVGSTGYSTGPHAHFEVRINGVTTDPMPYITGGSSN